MERIPVMKILVTDKSPFDYPSARVVRIEYSLLEDNMSSFKMHMSVINYMRKHILGTWGYSRTIQKSPTKASVYLFFLDDNDYLVFKLWCKHSVITTSIWPYNLMFSVLEEVSDDIQYTN